MCPYVGYLEPVLCSCCSSLRIIIEWAFLFYFYFYFLFLTLVPCEFLKFYITFLRPEGVVEGHFYYLIFIHVDT
jgi:hypothetical protein